MAKLTRAQTTANFINANPQFGMDMCCIAMVEAGMFKSNTEARDWFRYCVNQGHARGDITKGKGGRPATPKPVVVPVEQQEVNEVAMATAQATQGEPAHKDSLRPETLKERKARQARERRAAKRAQAA